MSLDDLQEDSRPVLHQSRKDLQQVAIVIKVHQNFQLLQLQSKAEISKLNKIDSCHLQTESDFQRKSYSNSSYVTR